MWTLEIGNNLAFALVWLGTCLAWAWYGQRNRPR